VGIYLVRHHAALSGKAHSARRATKGFEMRSDVFLEAFARNEMFAERASRIFARLSISLISDRHLVLGHISRIEIFTTGLL
jgi:hypothetical protein